MIVREIVKKMAEGEVREITGEELAARPWGRTELVAVEPLAAYEVRGRGVDRPELPTAPGLGWVLVIDGVVTLTRHGLLGEVQLHPATTWGDKVRVYPVEAYPVLAARWAILVGAHPTAESVAREEVTAAHAAGAAHAARAAVHRVGDPHRSPLDEGYPPEPTSREQVRADHAHDCTACRGSDLTSCACGECSTCWPTPRSNGTPEGDRAVREWRGAARERASAEADWLAQLARADVGLAHPDDGWVNQEEGTVKFAYPSLHRRDPAVGVLVALGTPERWRLVRLTEERKQILGASRWAFVEVPRGG